ncbi:MAG: hypothetical protein ACRC92_05125 [Peptostreptococcaceae bacterium]
MKLNSKLPIMVIGCTIAVFLGLSINNESDKPQIETKRGHISELEDININIREYESSFYYNFMHTINSADKVITKKEKKVDVGFEELNYVELLDVSCGQDYISHVGYEIDYSEDKNQIYFIVDERKNNSGSQILENQGNDNHIINENINLEKFNRTKIKLEYPNISPEIELAYIQSSYRYKGDLYLISNYSSKYPDNVYGKNYIVISKLDKETKKLQEVSSIDLKDKATMSEFLSVAKTISHNEKIYALVMSYKYDNSNDKGDDFYLLEYDLSTKESVINKINLNKPYHFLGAYEEDNKLNLILGNTRNKVDVIRAKYDILSKEIIDESKVTIESSDNYDKERYIGNTVVKQDKVYITVSDNSSYGSYQNNTKIYVIDKEDMYVTYEGNILGSEFIEIE